MKTRNLYLIDLIELACVALIVASMLAALAHRLGIWRWFPQ
jgi:hypothetical protein